MSWCFYLFLSSVLRQPFSLFTACSTWHCGTSACCLRWRWEGSLLCLRVGFSFLCAQSEATDGPREAKRKESAKRKKSADRSGKYFSTPETWTVECNCRRIFANIWFSQVWKHSSYTYAIPWCFKIWAWLRHEFLETAIPWWFTSKFWPRHELGMSLSFDCIFFLHAHIHVARLALCCLPLALGVDTAHFLQTYAYFVSMNFNSHIFRDHWIRRLSINNAGRNDDLMEQARLLDLTLKQRLMSFLRYTEQHECLIWTRAACFVWYVFFPQTHCVVYCWLQQVHTAHCHADQFLANSAVFCWHPFLVAHIPRSLDKKVVHQQCWSQWWSYGTS